MAWTHHTHQVQQGHQPRLHGTHYTTEMVSDSLRAAHVHQQTRARELRMHLPCGQSRTARTGHASPGMHTIMACMLTSQHGLKALAIIPVFSTRIMKAKAHAGGSMGHSPVAQIQSSVVCDTRVDGSCIDKNLIDARFGLPSETFHHSVDISPSRHIGDELPRPHMWHHHTQRSSVQCGCYKGRG